MDRFLPRYAMLRAVLPSQVICPSVCDVEVSWSYRLEFLISLTSRLCADPNITDVLQMEHPEILAGIGVEYGKL